MFVVMIEQPIAGSDDTMNAEYSGIWHETRSEAEKELKKARLDPEVWAAGFGLKKGRFKKWEEQQATE